MERKEKSILVLNGSPRPRGDGAQLLEEFSRHAPGALIQYDAYRCRIGPCVDCRWCWENDGCILRDCGDDLYRDIARCDGIVISSPIYYSTLTGPLISVLGRLQAFYAARRFRGKDLRGKRKPGIVLLTGGGDGSPKPALELAQIFMRAMNAEYLGWAGALHTDEIPAGNDEEALAQTRRLARKLIGWPGKEEGGFI